MTRFLLLLGSSLFIVGTAQAQLGLRVGGSLAQLHTTTGTNRYSRSSAQLGYQVGVTYRVPLTAWLALVPEVQYSHERTTLSEANYTIPDRDIEADSRLRLHYLNVPILLRATFGPVYVEAGPQASVLLGGRQMGTVTTASWGREATQPFDQAITDSYRRFDVGPCLGVGVQLPAGVGLSVRVYRGLKTLNYERQFLDGEHQRQSLQASLTYQLPTRQ